MKFKRALCPAALAVGALLLTLQPQIGMNAARRGLITWASALVPALFPYCFLAISLQRSLRCMPGRRMVWLTRLLGCPDGSAAALLGGFIGGNPTGAKLTAICAERGGASRGQYLRLAWLSSACSPAFALGTLSGALPGRGWILLVSCWLGILLGSLLMRAFGEDETRIAPMPRAARSEPPPMLEAAQAMLTIGCCVVLFSVLSAYLYWAALLFAPHADPLYPAFAHALLEMAGGTQALSELSGPWVLPLICFAIAFGGLSIGVQALAFLRPLDIPAGRYLAGKALHGVLAALVCHLLMRAGAVETAAQSGLTISEPVRSQAVPALVALALGAAAALLNRRFIAYENAEDEAKRAAAGSTTPQA